MDAFHELFFTKKPRTVEAVFSCAKQPGGRFWVSAGRCPGHLGINNDNGGRSQQTREHWRREFSKLPLCVGVPFRAGVAR